MVSLIGRFMRDLPYLREGQVPKRDSAQEVDELDYTGEEHEKLTDQDVKDLSDALVDNNAFSGNIELNKNDLTDLSALYLAQVFEKTSGQNIKKLKLDENNFTTKAGEYIGGALSANPSYPLKKLSFAKMSLESIGMVRVVEACNLNQNITSLNLGIVTNEGLARLAELLRENTSLESLAFEETDDHQKYWTGESR